MDFILNEKSLRGQFDTVHAFFQTLSENVKCFRLIGEDACNRIYKTSDFYECQVTSKERLRDLRKYADDEVLELQLQLDSVIYSLPHWDTELQQDLDCCFRHEGEDVTATGIAEAAVRGDILLSFALNQYMDRDLEVSCADTIYQIPSVFSQRYLVQRYGKKLHVSSDDILKIRYDKTRVDCSLLDRKYGTGILNDAEIELLIHSLDKMVQHDSWESIALDDGLEYKKYSPASDKDNWFRNTPYAQKTIMKIRFSDVHRAYGYRKGERFRILRLERDHRVSDKG